MNDEQTPDWTRAEEHLKTYEEAYKKLVGMPGVNPFFALGSIAEVRRRFDSGERTLALYERIMEIE